jgi:hypothetical protein
MLSKLNTMNYKGVWMERRFFTPVLEVWPGIISL